MNHAAMTLVFALVLAPAARAQDSVTYRSAQDLAAAGRVDSARSLLRRLVIENSNSPWADDALLQLVQMAHAGGNAALAIELAARLRSDYPGSELRSRSALWAGRAAFDAGEPRAACAMLDSALAEAGTDIEHANQIAFYRGRCAALAAIEPPPRSPLTADSSRAPTAAAFDVQVAATRSEAEARSIARRFESAGYTVRVERSADGFSRVRIGPFRSREEAESAARAARIIVGGSPFVVPGT